MLQYLKPIIIERIGSKFTVKFLFRGSQHNFSNKVFHDLCDKYGPLLILVKSCKNIIFRGFSVLPWRNDGEGKFTEDPKSVLFSLTSSKAYPC